jgi:hypothetical protein
MIATPKLEGERYQRLQKQIEETKGALQDIEISKVTKYLLAQIPNGHIFYQSRDLQKILNDPLSELLVVDESDSSDNKISDVDSSMSI